MKGFETITHFLHFNNNAEEQKTGEEGYDRLSNVRTTFKMLRNRFLKVPIMKCQWIDD